MVVLLSESASLTARETLTVLGSGGLRADVLATGRLSIGRFSRWRRRLIAAPPPGADPFGYLSLVAGLCSAGEYEAVLATHEQAWLFAAGRHLLPADAPIAVAPIEAFDRVAGKVEFAVLLDELGIPQPRWWRCDERPARVPYPHWVKASYGTAGQAVRRVHTAEQERQAVRELSETGGVIMGQAPAAGQYGQVQALFDHGELVAAHTSVAVGSGAGGSAAARLSVDHPAARDHAARVGAELRWHGGLTLDYFHVDGQPQFIECNPRTVEPGNAACAGVDLPRLTIALSRGRQLPGRPVIGRPGVRTRSALALALGAAERRQSRAAVLGALRDCALRCGETGRAAEVLTPIVQDPPSALPLAAAAASLLASPHSAARLTYHAVGSYSVSPATIALVRAGSPASRT
jgi:biotin carboxylase